jgi:hypothetical protein
MPSARTWIILTCAFTLAACDAAPAEPSKTAPEKTEDPAPAKAEPPAPAKAEPPASTKVEPPAPAKVEPPLSFTFETRTFTAAVALSSRFNDQRRIVISSQPTTCEDLLAMPEQFKKGNVSFIVTSPWTVGTHALTSAEILDDDTRKVTNIYPASGTIEILAAPQGVGERGKIVLSATAPEGGANGEIEVELCE